MVVVSDTTPISNLIQIGKIALLETLFGKVIIPSAVADELKRIPKIRSVIELAGWIKIVAVPHEALYHELRSVLDAGETEAIILIKQENTGLLIMDERKGHRIAMNFGIATTGTIGILIRAKEAGLIGNVKDQLIRLKNETDFWISDQLIADVLQSINE